MRSYIFTSDNQKELELLIALAERLGVNTFELSDEEKEDIALYGAMLEGTKQDYVAESEIREEIKK